MLRKWVEVLAPARYRLADGRVVAFTPADCQNAVEQGRKMLAAGLRVPGCWMHDDAAAPAANLARDYFGELLGYRLSAAGTAQALVNIPDRADARQFLKVNGVSPRVQRDWTDETGRVWAGCTIGHLAATPTPVQRHLRRPAADLSHVPGSVAARAVYDLGNPIREGPMAAETDDDAGGAGDAGSIASIRDSLAQLDIALPDDVADLAALDMALKVAVSVKGGGGLDDDPDPDPTEPGPDAPVFMSHTHKLAATRLAASDGRDLKRRVAALFATGRVDGPTRKKLDAELAAVNLSHAHYDAALNLKPLKVADRIEAYEQLPPGRLLDGGGRGKTEPADLPADLSHGDEADDLLKRQEELAARHSVKAR